MVMEDRVSRLEGAYEQVDRRLGDLNQSVQSLRQEINDHREETRQSTESIRDEIKSQREETRQIADSLREEMRQNRAEANRRINLMLLLIGGIWATILGGFIALVLKLGA